jgi:hypothetical protein
MATSMVPMITTIDSVTMKVFSSSLPLGGSVLEACHAVAEIKLYQ